MSKDNNKTPINILFIGNRPSDIANIKSYLKESKELIFHIEHRPDFFGSSDLFAGSRRIDVILLDLGIFAASQAEETFRRMVEMAHGIPIIVFTDRKDHETALNAIKHGAADNITRGDSKVDFDKFRDAIEFSIARAGIASSIETQHTKNAAEAQLQAQDDLSEALEKSEVAMDRQKDRYAALVRNVIDKGDEDIVLAVRQVSEALADSKFENSILVARLKNHKNPDVIPIR